MSRGKLPFFLAIIGITIFSSVTQSTKAVDYILASISNVNPVGYLAEHTQNNSTPSISFDDWARHENELRQLQIAHSKDVFLPDWLLNYVVWHREQRTRLYNNTAYNDDIKYLVVRCLKREVCGGLSDRLKSMPFYIMLANLTQRVLLIHWTKPCALENFLQPPSNGLDWRMDGTAVTITDIQNDTNFHDGHGISMSSVVRQLMGKSAGLEQLVQAKVLNILLDGGQMNWHAKDIFNKWRKEPGQVETAGAPYLGWNATKSNVTKHDLFEDVFRILFEPSPKLQGAIYDKLSQLDLLGKEYSVAQVRAKHPEVIPSDAALEWGAIYAPDLTNAYDIKRRMDMMTVSITPMLQKLYLKLYSNALECADQLAPRLPIYLASDTDFGMQMKNLTQYPIRVAATQNDTVLHIDSDDNQGRDPSDFYLIFIDLYIMARAKCLSHDNGGFGSFPIRITGNACHLIHSKTECIGSSSNQTLIDAENSSAENAT